MTSTITDERLKEILDGCEGVTPGPWAYETDDGSSMGWLECRSDFPPPHGRCLADINGDSAEQAINAEHLARLSPEVVSSIVSEILAAREALSNHVAAVEQAFRDGLEYATNVTVVDPDLAWQTSRARALLGNGSGK